MKIICLVTVMLLSPFWIRAQGVGQIYDGPFVRSLSKILKDRGLTLEQFCSPSDPVKRRILFEYGVAYLSVNAKLPKSCLMDEKQVVAFKSSAGIDKHCYKWGGNDSCFQKTAKNSLNKLFKRVVNTTIVRQCTEGDDCMDSVNTDWAFRSYSQARKNWEKHKSERRIDADSSDADVLTRPYSSKEKPYMFSYAIPGASQHHLGLAIDVRSAANSACKMGSKCAQELADEGWYRTIRYDRYHFTYTGLTLQRMKEKGLKEVTCSFGGETFNYWVPDEPKYEDYDNWKCSPVK